MGGLVAEWIMGEKTDAQRAHDTANDEMAMMYNEAEERDLVLHAKNDFTRHRYTVTTLRSVKDWQAQTAKSVGRIFIALLVLIILELLHKDGASSALASLLHWMAAP